MPSEQTIQQIQKLLSQLSSEIGVEKAKARLGYEKDNAPARVDPKRAPSSSPPVTTSQPGATAVSIYRVQQGDTVTAIANSQGVSIARIRELNPNINIDMIYPGQTLVLHRDGHVNSVQQAAEATVALDGDTRIIRCSSPVDPTCSSPIPPKWIVALGYGQIYPAGYGKLSGKLHSGIDLNLAFDGDRGKPVYAIQDGQVGFAKAGKKGDLDGWGSLITIKHDDGYISRYGHCISLRVQAGDTVKAGQMIARIGGEEYGFANHLHFDIGIPGGIRWHAIDWSAFVNQAELDKHCINPVTYFALRNGQSPN